MAVTKTVSVRVLVAFSLESQDYKPNQVIEQPPSVVAMLKEMGYVDDDPAAVAYCLKTAGS